MQSARDVYSFSIVGIVRTLHRKGFLRFLLFSSYVREKDKATARRRRKAKTKDEEREREKGERGGREYVEYRSSRKKREKINELLWMRFTRVPMQLGLLMRFVAARKKSEAI